MRNLLKQGKVEESREVAKEIAALQPFNIDLRVDLAHLYLEEKHLSEALELLGELAQLYLDRKELGRAIDLYRDMVEIFREQERWDKFWEYREKIAELYYQDHQVEKALGEYRQLLETTLRDGDFEKIERLYENLGDWNKALEILGFIAYQYEEMGNAFEAIGAHKRIAEIYLELNNIDEAIEEYYQMIQLHLKEQELSSAMELFEQVRNWRPTSKELLFRMAEALFENEYFEESMPLYRQLLEMEPGHFEGMTRLAIIYAKRGDLAEAVGYAKRIFSKGRVSKIIDEYKKAIHLDEGEPRAYLNLGLFYREMGFAEEAIEQFQIASRKPETRLEAFNLLGTTFKQEGFVQLALKQFQKALSLTDEYDEEDLQDIRYEMAQAYQEIGAYEDALAMFSECYAIDIRYRDVAKKINELTQLIEAGGREGGSADTLES